MPHSNQDYLRHLVRRAEKAPHVENLRAIRGILERMGDLVETLLPKRAGDDLEEAKAILKVELERAKE